MADLVHLPGTGRPGMVRVVPVMGTVFTLDIRDPQPPIRTVAGIIRWWRWVDDTFSPFRPGSQINRLTSGTLTPGECAAEVAEVLSLCQQANKLTGGYFDACADGSIDPCGLVKGWSIEAASEMLTAAGSPNHCINGGGDIRCAGQPEPGRPWHVGIADPLHPGTLAAGIATTDAAIATSGTAERGHHVINPHTGRPPAGLASVTLTGPDLTWADAYATAAFAMGDRAWDWLSGLDGHEALIIYADGTRHQTPGWAGRSFPGPSRNLTG